MRFTFAVAAFSAVLSTTSAVHLAARQGDFPSCAVSCVATPASTFGCSATDNDCLCHSEQYVAATTQCIEGACSAEDAQTAEAFSRQLCAQVGVTLTATPTPTSSSGDSSSSAADATSSATSSGSSESSSGSSSSSAPTSSATAPGSSSSSLAASSDTSAAPSPTNTTSGAMTTGVDALVGIAALFLAALNL